MPVRPQQRVDAVDDPAEEASVQRLAHGVPHLRRLLHRVGPDDGLPPRHHAVGGQGLLELVRADAQQRRHWRSTEGSDVSVWRRRPCDPACVGALTVFQDGNVDDVALVRLVLRRHRRELHVAGVEDGRQGAVNAAQLLRQQATAPLAVHAN